MLLHRVGKSRETELEALGRASGLEHSIAVLQSQNDILTTTNRMLMDRLLGGGASVPAGMGYAAPMAHTPPVVHGVPLGSPPMRGGLGLAPQFDPALPPPPMNAHPREHANYAGGPGNDRDFDPFSDVGDREADRQGIKLDEMTGALEGMSLPVKPQ